MSLNNVKDETGKHEKSCDIVKTADIQSQKKPNIMKRIGFLICGINLKEYKKSKTAEAPIKVLIDTSIDETPIWSTVCNIGAILAISASGFVFAFFNKYN